MGEIFLDITPLLDFAVRHRSVSGIQRVEARLIAELSRLPRGDRVWCADIQPGGAQIRAWRLHDVMRDHCHTDLAPFVRLATISAEGMARSWHDLRRRLNHRGLRGWQRASAKAAFLLARAASLAGARAPDADGIPCTHLESFPHDSTVVLLGASWNTAQVGKALNRSPRGVRAVHCTYDLIPLVHPEYFEQRLCRAFTRHFSDAAELCTDFLCISRHTQSDLEGCLAAKGYARRSAVVRLPHEFHGYPRNAAGCMPSDPRLTLLTSAPRPYVLCVGTIEIRKNGLGLLSAWRLLRDLMGDSVPRLIMCGRRGWKVDPLYSTLQDDRWLQSQVTIVPSADDADLAHLYEHAMFTVYPSLYEGWGLPVGEAAWFGKHCIASNASSIPEVCGELVEYVDPQDLAEIARRVHRAATDPGYLASREARIREAPLRTWPQFAAEFLAALEPQARHAPEPAATVPDNTHPAPPPGMRSHPGEPVA